MRTFSLLLFIFWLAAVPAGAQAHISDFISIDPTQTFTPSFVFPSSHRFQVLAKTGDTLTAGGLMPTYSDFTGYVPINGSSTMGYLSVNSEITPGGVTVFDVQFDPIKQLWWHTASEAIDFTPVVATHKNCSGAVTPWNTIITSEETQLAFDSDGDGYWDQGWNIEIDPATRTIVRNEKLWKQGNFLHENICIHPNHRTVYQGADSSPGYLFKFVADTAQNLHSGRLYAYNGSKAGAGIWIPLDNSTPDSCNQTLQQCAAKGATTFSGIEDVEVGPDGWVYFAVKGEGCTYRFRDSDPVSGLFVPQMETFVGNMSYPIDYGTDTMMVPWGFGDDNLAFDNLGNLWVMNDGNNNCIWVVEQGHTQAESKVKLFGRSPIGAEPTGLTFSPDNRFMFMSMQHPSGTNQADQIDAAGRECDFNTHTTLVMALHTELGSQPPQPIVYLQFEAQRVNDDMRLDWFTTLQPKAAYYAIEMRKDTFDWVEISQVPAALVAPSGIQSYSFLHPNAVFEQAEYLYYRIKQVNTDSSIILSDLRFIELDRLLVLHVFPNPSDGVDIQCGHAHQGSEILVCNTLGTVVHSTKMVNNDPITFNLNHLPNGYYFVMCADPLCRAAGRVLLMK